MSTQEKQSWQFTRARVPLPDELAGLLINVSGLPTLGVDGVERVGGVGQSAVALNLERLFQQPKSFDIGTSTRDILARRLNRAEPLDDKEVQKEVARLAKLKDYSLDYELDEAVLTFAQEILSIAPVVVVATKIFPLLSSADELLESGIASLSIGIEVSDEMATFRKHHAGKVYKGESRTLSEVSAIRAQRYVSDQEKYAGAYPGIIYSREGLLKGTQVVFNNDTQRNGPEMQNTLKSLLYDVSVQVPALQPLILQALALQVVEN